MHPYFILYYLCFHHLFCEFSLLYLSRSGAAAAPNQAVFRVFQHDRHVVLHCSLMYAFDPHEMMCFLVIFAYFTRFISPFPLFSIYFANLALCYEFAYFTMQFFRILLTKHYFSYKISAPRTNFVPSNLRKVRFRHATNQGICRTCIHSNQR